MLLSEKIGADVVSGTSPSPAAEAIRRDLRKRLAPGEAA
jgi:hypothetical protein